eukprot:scaffold4157_cov136-Cylindrotheca_fusiformis.AAC.26
MSIPILSTPAMLRNPIIAIVVLLFRTTGSFPVLSPRIGVGLPSQLVYSRCDQKPSRQTVIFASNKKKKAPITKQDEIEDVKDAGILSKPANLIVIPFVALFGLDLVANILVVVKRSIEVLLTGQYTCTGPWC